jgi:4-hydroxy-3-polyprenylbenzoate decarboxylase
MLRELGIKTHLVVTKGAERTRHYEIDLSATELAGLATAHHVVSDLGSPIASGSFLTAGMIIAPCSMKTLAEIAHGLSSNLLTRTADVMLKERRRLVLLPRETPLHAVHLKNMLAVTEMGGIISPPVPAFYQRPQTIDDIVNHTLGRVLDLFGLEWRGLRRWGSEDRSLPRT